MKTVIITGAAGGLGHALIEVFSAADYRLILQYRNSDLPEGYPADCIHGDLRMLGTIDDIVAAAIKRGADILINNAAVYRNLMIDEITDCDIREIIETNLISPMILTRKIWQLFEERGNGLIVNINSIAAKFASRGESVYCASKCGLAGFSRTLQFEGPDSNIKILDVFVGAMDTRMTVGRKDSPNLISPYEVAQCIENVCSLDLDSLKISEITLQRTRYKS